MKGKYITLQIRMACLTKPRLNKNIHEQLEETIAERKQVMKQMEKVVDGKIDGNLFGYGKSRLNAAFAFAKGIL